MVLADLEVKLALEAMRHFGKKDLDRLKRLHTEMETCADGFYGLDRLFHDEIYRKSKLSHLCDIVQKLILPVEVYLNINRQKDDDCRVFNEQHRKIIDDLKSKNSKQLQSALSANIESGLRVIEKNLDRTFRFGA